MQENSGNIKQLAKAAKSRMKNGFWTAVKQQRDDDVACALISGKSTEVVLKDYSQMLRSKIYQDLSDEDEVFYQKVCDLLNSDEIITNPIGRLIDAKFFEGLSQEGKQHYILEISNKYKQMKERYEQEKTFLKFK